jgi:hypothetical protein
MMAGKGQITLFIVAGIVILMTVLIIIYSGNKENTGVQEGVSLSQDAQSVYMFVQSCIDKTVKQGSVFIAAQGGYFYPPENVFETQFSNIPYYYYEGQIIMVNQTQLKKNFENYVTSRLMICTDNFNAFEGRFNITEGYPTTTADITNDKINVNIKYPITVASDNRKESMINFQSSYDINLGKLRNLSEQLMSEIIIEPELIPISDMISMENDYGVLIDAYDKDNSTTVYMIQDNSSISLQNQMNYVFAVKTK